MVAILLAKSLSQKNGARKKVMTPPSLCIKKYHLHIMMVDYPRDLYMVVKRTDQMKSAGKKHSDLSHDLDREPKI